MRLTLAETADDADSAAVWAVHDEVFGDHPDEATWREAVWDRHTTRAGFRVALAHDDRGVVGAAHGYTGADGQWWTDHAREALDPAVGEAWLGGHFEVVSIGVLARARRCGVGRELLRLLLDGLPHDRFLLMTTADPTDPARRLYAAEGWDVLGPGIGDDTVIMGMRPGSVR